jgi:hypothetical protein
MGNNGTHDGLYIYIILIPQAPHSGTTNLSSLERPRPESWLGFLENAFRNGTPRIAGSPDFSKRKGRKLHAPYKQSCYRKNLDADNALDGTVQRPGM